MEQKLCPGCMKPKQHGPFCEHCGYDERQQNLQHQLSAGTRLHDQYVIGRVLGQGGFGITYMGWDDMLQMPVAIKEYFPNGMVYRNIAAGNSVQFYSGEDEEAFLKHRERFLREARTLAQLSSLPEIVQVKTFFLENNTAYIVMEYVEGMTLKDYIRRIGRPLSAEETIRIMYPVMRGLASVHEKGLIHRDVSPDNIMLLRDGNVKLIDFGTVRYLNDSARSKSTESVLKPGFAPMEQYNTKGNIGPWTDVYALCATFHYCLTGRLPADAPSRIETGEGLPLLTSVPGIPASFVRTLERGMTIRVADRIQNIPDLMQQLYSREPAFIPEDAPEDPRNRGGISTDPGKKKLILIGAVAAAVLAVVLCIGLFGQKDPSPQEPSVNAGPASYENAAWYDNVLMADPADGMLDEAPPMPVLNLEIRRDEVRSVTFLDNFSSAPDEVTDVSADQDSSVLAWTEPNGDLYDVYIAADGGINGSISCRGLFKGYTNLESIAFNGAFHTDEATDMLFMFAGCPKLTELDLKDFRTANVTNMNAMFNGCSSLTHLDLSSFDTGKVTRMSTMFYNCSSLKELDLSNFNTENVTLMGATFEHCSSLTRLDVSSFRTGLVTDMQFLFSYCSALPELDVSHFDTSSAVNMTAMFQEMHALKELDLSSFRTGNVTAMNQMFYGCSSLRTLDVSSFDTASVTDMRSMFFNCKSLDTLILGTFDTGAVTDFDSFYHNTLLPDGTAWATLFYGDRRTNASANTTSGNAWKQNVMMEDRIDPNSEEECNSTVFGHAYVRRVDIHSVTFLDSTASAGAGSWDISKEKNGSVIAWLEDSGNSTAPYDLYIAGNGGVNGEFACPYLFQYYTNCVEIRFNGAFRTENATAMRYMFSTCSSLKSVDLETLDTSSCTNMFAMFDDCHQLRRIDVSGFDTRNVTSFALMFNNCLAVEELDVSGFDTAKAEDMAFMFADCRNMTHLDVSNFDTSLVWDMSYMFYNCKALTYLNLGSFDTSAVTSSALFYHKDTLPDGTYWKNMF